MIFCEVRLFGLLTTASYGFVFTMNPFVTIVYLQFMFLGGQISPTPPQAHYFRCYIEKNSILQRINSLELSGAILFIINIINILIPIYIIIFLLYVVFTWHKTTKTMYACTLNNKTTCVANFYDGVAEIISQFLHQQ